MNSQLLVGGVLVAVMGFAFYAFPIPLIYFWSLPFIVGGALMAVASPFVAERKGPVLPPPGYRFCVFCSEPVKLESTRCQRCGGAQPPVTS